MKKTKQSSEQKFINESHLEPQSVRVWFSRIGTIAGVGKNLYAAHINTVDREMTFEEDVERALKSAGFDVYTYGSGNEIIVSRDGLKATKAETMIGAL